MALTTKTPGAPLIGGAPLTKMNKKCFITRPCAVRGVSVKPGAVVDVSFGELHQIIGAKRGVEYDPREHKEAKPVKVPGPADKPEPAEDAGKKK